MKKRRKQRNSRIFPMNNLPIDILTNILGRLPVKPLLHLKIVCKSWQSLITSADFAAFHLRHHHSFSSKRLLIATDNSSNLYSIDIDSLDSSAAVKLLQLPIKFPFKSAVIAGSCNGILCLRGDSLSSKKLKESIVLLNPRTQEYKVVGNLRYPSDNYLGLGYDSDNNEHKLVSLSYHSKTLPSKGDGLTTICRYCVTRVYSLKTNSWSLIEDDGLSNIIGSHTCYGYEGGALIGNNLLHWIFRSFCPERFPDIIGCFDVCENRWKAVRPPAFVETENDRLDKSVSDRSLYDSYNVRGDDEVYVPKLFTVGVLDECLCLVTNNRVRSDVYDVWVMKEYGVAESWVKLLGVADSRVTVYETYCPITWSRDGRELMLLRKSKLCWYDVGEKTLRKTSFCLDVVPGYRSVSVFRKSLAKVSGDSCAN